MRNKTKTSTEQLLIDQNRNIQEGSANSKSTCKSSGDHIYFKTNEESPSMSINKDTNDNFKNQNILKNEHLI